MTDFADTFDHTKMAGVATETESARAYVAYGGSAPQELVDAALAALAAGQPKPRGGLSPQAIEGAQILSAGGRDEFNRHAHERTMFWRSRTGFGGSDWRVFANDVELDTVKAVEYTLAPSGNQVVLTFVHTPACSPVEWAARGTTRLVLKAVNELGGIAGLDCGNLDVYSVTGKIGAEEDVTYFVVHLGPPFPTS